jgi:hypothetical protein
MLNIGLGNLFTLKNHPFQENYNEVLIGADATFTPPIMVVCEILNSGGNYNGDDGTKEINQVRGLFFSHKTHKYEKHWFKIDEVKVLCATTSPLENEIATENTSLEDLKSKFRNKQVILKSVDLELGKNKISQERRNFENLLLKRNPYLDFIPPVMTVIDVRVHETIKDNYHKTTGKKKRMHSEFEFKCRYYNPLSTTYSEEWISKDSLFDITNNFDLSTVIPLIDKHFAFPLENPVQFEDNDFWQISTLIKLKEIVFYHYRYVIIAEDLLSSRTIKVEVEKALSLTPLDFDDLFEKRVPNKTKRFPLKEKDFLKNGLYEISYLSDRGVSTNRLIYITDKYSIGTDEKKDYLLVANCFLRNGKIRNFKISNIKSYRKVKKSANKDFIQQAPSE